jgi:hypothetical protein
MNYESIMDEYWATESCERMGPMVFARWRKMIAYVLPDIKDKRVQRRIFDNCVRRGYFTRQKMARVCLWFYTYIPPQLERLPQPHSAGGKE